MLTVLPWAVAVSDWSAAAACGFLEAFNCIMLTRNCTPPASVLASWALSAWACAVKLTVAPNFTPPATDCTFINTFWRPAATPGMCTTGAEPGRKLEGGTVVSAQASSAALNCCAWVTRAAGRMDGLARRSMAALTSAMSPAATSEPLRNATPCVCFGSSRMVTPE